MDDAMNLIEVDTATMIPIAAIFIMVLNPEGKLAHAPSANSAITLVHAMICCHSATLYRSHSNGSRARYSPSSPPIDGPDIAPRGALNMPSAAHPANVMIKDARVSLLLPAIQVV